jgi:tRNA G46 methylase TrmB
MSTKKIRRFFNRGTKKSYINKLKNLYPKCKFDKNIDDYSLYSGNNITYGEMEYEGMKQLYSYINKNYNSKINTFIDVGSGRGKLCMYMAAQPKIKYVLGIELVKQRHDDAEILKSEIDHEYASKVILLNKNIFDIDFDIQIDNLINKNIFIWFSNLCFDISIVDDIFKKIQRSLPKGTIVCCSKKPSQNFGEFLNTIQIPMSWNKASNVYIYKL